MIGRVIGGVVGVFFWVGFVGVLFAPVLVNGLKTLGAELFGIYTYSDYFVYLVYIVISCVISFFWLYNKGRGDADAQIDQMKSAHKKEVDELVSLVKDIRWEQRTAERRYREQAETEIATETQKLDKERRVLKQTCNNLRQYNKILRSSMLTRAAGYESMHQAIAKLDEVVDEGLAAYLENKKRPALSAAETVREQTKLRRKAEVEAKTARSIIEYYERSFPDLAEIRQNELEGGEEDQKVDNTYTERERQDPATRLLARVEYLKLTPSERNQLALDRYWKRRHSNKHVGRMYERYIGYIYECQGYAVSYYGIDKELDDLGRDLVCVKGKKAVIVQCKNWSRHKTVRENRVFQHFGTVFEYKQQHPDMNVTAAFYTTTAISDVAKEFAKTLGMEIFDNYKFDKSYPCIKCNIGRDGSKIYHLPFDQQYDKVNIEPARGEFFAKTVKEAEDAGFRRAYRWQGNKS